MPKYNIVQVDSIKNKSDIINLWRNNLPDVSESRLEWMNNNPEGSPIWFLAFHEEKKQIAGSISIMPRKVKINGKTYLAGIVGDFMVEKAFRAFGPALHLIKKVVGQYTELGFAFIYTFPNPGAEKLATRAGFEETTLIKKLVKPLRINRQLDKFIPHTFVNIISPGFNLALKLISKDTFVGTSIKCNEVTEQSPTSESFLKSIESKMPTLGVRNIEYIKWKYQKNPHFHFKMFVLTNTIIDSVMGYILVSLQNNIVNIYDILFDDEENIKEILAGFLKYAREEKYDSVSIRISQNPLLTRVFKYFGFYDRNEHVSLLFAGDKNLLPEDLMFFDGDRNI